MSGPQTEAGRTLWRLLRELFAAYHEVLESYSLAHRVDKARDPEPLILAIEAEARAASQERPQPFAHCQDCGYAHPIGDLDCPGEAQERPPIDVALDLLREWIEHHQPEGYEGIQDCADINDRTEAFLSRQ